MVVEPSTRYGLSPRWPVENRAGDEPAAMDFTCLRGSVGAGSDAAHRVVSSATPATPREPFSRAKSWRWSRTSAAITISS